MWYENELTNRLGVKYPIIQAGMAGGPTTPELVAAVSNAGGLGTLGAGYMPPESVRQAVKSIKKLTDKPFGVNLFIPEKPRVEKDKIDQMKQKLKKYREELHIGADEVNASVGQSFGDQLNVLAEEQVPVFSFTFGNPSADVISYMKDNHVTTIGTATTVREALMLEENGVDMICGQGSEAGGHRGTFGGNFDEAMVGTIALVPQLVDAVNVPVVAAGGIMDGRGIAASLALGAQGVQMGTAFLAANESGAHPEHKMALKTSTDESTVITRAFSGKPARGIRNDFIKELDSYGTEYPDYPIQNTLTRGIRKAAGERNKTAYMSLWAGQAAHLSRELSAQQLIEQFISETDSTFNKFQ